MTDERNPSNDVLDAVYGCIATSIGRTGNNDDGWFTPSDYADWVLHDLSAAGFVVLRVPEGTDLRHGDELHASVYAEWIDGYKRHFFFVRRPVPEPATKPEPCTTCDGEGDVLGHEGYGFGMVACSACGGSGVATTEGDKQ